MEETGASIVCKSTFNLGDVLCDEHVSNILRQVTGRTDCEVICGEVRPATRGLAGFAGEHVRVVLHVNVRDVIRKLHLFVKRVPVDNKPKAEFIELNNYFKKEVLMLNLVNDMQGAEGPNPWGPRTFINTDTLIVMPDLSEAGYSTHPLLVPLDLPHVLVTAASLARYHAAFANYEANKILMDSTYSFYDIHKHLLVEPTFQCSQWIHSAAKLTANFLDAFSLKYSKDDVLNLEEKLAKSLQDASESLNVIEDNFNVMLHKDLWNNNILFKNEAGVPTNAVLIDFQCVRYGPPAFDIMSFLYLTTSRTFREKNESKVLKHYWEVFYDSLQDGTRKRLAKFGYNEQEFLCWCEKSRMFGASEAVAMFPQVLMDARAAEVVDDHSTVEEEQDRSAAVLGHARDIPGYRLRNLEVCEEFVKKYVI